MALHPRLFNNISGNLSATVRLIHLLTETVGRGYLEDRGSY
jgi:hypothetical protein